MQVYVYKQTEPGLWTVGWYDSNGTWQPESDHGSPLGAAYRTHWLNGRNVNAALLEAAQQALGAIDALIAESGGVQGLHQNGDIAPWSELVAGGQFEEWLLPLEELRAAIVKAKGGGQDG